MTAIPATAATRRSIRQTFDDLRQRGRLAFMPFIPAGYPDLATTALLLPGLEAAGADLIEIGFPFSDPIADGPTIQESYTAALEKKITVGQILTMIGQVRARVAVPLVGMVSYSIVYRIGLDSFLSQAKSAGLDGLILPDLPPPEAESVCGAVRAAGLDTILLVAPTTSPQRREEIARLCSGFVYYLSVSGITGERDRLPPGLAEGVRQLRSITDRPICVGFGIAQARHIDELAKIADGAIVGSAIVKRIKETQHQGPAAVLDAVQRFCRELLVNRRG